MIEHGNLVGRAIALAAEVHRDQVDLAGEPYILHPIRMVIAARLEGHGEVVQAACALHDVIEDSGGAVTWATLWKLFGGEVANAVEACTRRANPEGDKEPYGAFCARAATSYHGRHVKRLDLLDHLARPTPSNAEAAAKVASLGARYRAGLEVLERACAGWRG